MIIAGAKGLAGELLEILFQKDEMLNLCFFDNISDTAPALLHDRFPVIRSLKEAKEFFQKTGDRSFCLGLGSPQLRHRVAYQFEEIGGKLLSVVSPKADVGKFGISIGAGCCILPGAVITSNVRLGKGCLINPNATVSHDCSVGDFVEVSPGANVTGNCHVGDFSFLGANCVILPKIIIGKNVTVAAGAVVTENVKDNCMVAGVPAVVKKSLPPLNL